MTLSSPERAEKRIGTRAADKSIGGVSSGNGVVARGHLEERAVVGELMVSSQPHPPWGRRVSHT